MLRLAAKRPFWLVSGRGRRCFGMETLNEFVLPFKVVLDTVHTSTGLGWPVLIPLVTVALRGTITAPLAVWNRVRARRQAKLQPLLSGMVPVLKAQLAQQAVTGKGLTPEQIMVLAAKERRQRRIRLYREFKCQNWKLLVLPAIQIPLFVAMSLSIRSLCGYQLLPTDFGLVDQSGLFWCPSLTKPDPYGVFPLLIGAMSLGNVELVSRPFAAATPAGKPSVAVALANMSRAGAVVFMVLAFQAPLALELYWLSSNAFSLAQNALLERYLPVTPPPSYPHLDPAVISSPLPDSVGVTSRNSVEESLPASATDSTENPRPQSK